MFPFGNSAPPIAYIWIRHKKKFHDLLCIKTPEN